MGVQFISKMKIMKKRWCSIAVFLCYSGVGFAQNMISFSEARPYDESRYEDIKASPYFFESFAKAWITDTEGVKYAPVLANFNGYTDEFEVRQEDQFIRLDEQHYSRIALLPEGKVDTVYFIRGVHADFRGKFIQEIYESEQVILVRKFKVGLTSTVINNVGRKDEIKRFSPQNDLFLLKKKDNVLIPLKGNEKKMLKELGHEKELASFLKEDKSVDLNTDQGLAALIKKWETLQF